MMNKNNIIRLEDINNSAKYLGAKTLNLKKCADWGFNVPKFIALPSYISKNLLTDENFRKKIAQETINILGNNQYAVRSSALIEDTETESYAGQFLTKINIKGDNLENAIKEVLIQAEAFLHGDLDKFSMIIQDYIDPDISGIAFTRNPNCEREMIIEYGFCEGEKIVSGEIKPEKKSFYWDDQPNENLPKQFSTNQIVEQFKNLERKNGFPQDIEWCIKDNQFYLLQTRPITTISKKNYEQICFLENILPKDKKYYFEKTEISEIAGNPTTITYDLLNIIYSKNEPVDKVYKKYGINYENTKFLKIIGNELFVDKEKEIQGLLPSYSYLGKNDFLPRFHNFSKFFSTIRNLFFLNIINTKNYEKIFNNLKTKIESEVKNNLNLKIALEQFLTDYELIFETNLLSGLSIKKLNSLLKNEPINFSQIIEGSSQFIDLNKYQIQLPKNIKGNSLELADESTFIANETANNKKTDILKTWWGKLPEYKKTLMQKTITEAIIYNRVREYGRWLTLKNINILKNLLLDYATKNEFKDTKNIFFAKFEDILNNKVNESDCIKTKNIYEKYNNFSFPNRITSSLIINESKTLGVSSGVAIGILQNIETIETCETKNNILYTKILSPDLTKYFDKITGIISDNGGVLSHLAIIARERNIPAIVGFSNSNNEIKIGDKVQINGSNGEILKL